MASTTQVFQKDNNNGNNPEFSRHEIQNAIAKAVELRALHAALTQGSSPGPSPSPAIVRFPSPSPVSRSASHFSAQDYPVFTPVSNMLYHFFFIFVGYNFVFYFFLKLGFYFS